MKNLILFVLVFLSIRTIAQSDLHCATDQVMKKIFEKYPEVKVKLDQHERETRNLSNKRILSSSYTIPIVFHVLYLDEPENISDSQIIDEVAILNRDYAKHNADTAEIIPAFKSIADATGIQFALATLDPNGNCTTGIIHHYDPDTDWNDLSSTLYSYTWDPTKYLNVYVVRTITLSSGFGAAGYTYFPGTFGAGDSQDAIVVLNNYLGSIGTGSAFQSRTLTHEVGHWFNLLHVFGFNNAATDCTGDDYVNDTPPTPGYLSCPDAGNPFSYQQCTVGVDENFQNYMDYSYCCRMFTQEQALRMRTALNDNIVNRDNLWSASNLIATGITNPSSPCVPIADFRYNRSKTCVGAPVTFTDASWNGQPTAYAWSFPSGTPSTSTSATPMVTYSAPGTYSVTLTTSNITGTSAPVVKTGIITVTNAAAAYHNTWQDSFETSSLPNNDWTLVSSCGSVNWEQSADAAYTGLYSVKLDADNNTRNAITSMISPSIDLSSVINPSLSFKLAATELNPAHINKLQVFASTDCGQTWSEVYNKIGNALITTMNNQQVPFIPVTQNEWRVETVSLSSVAGAAAATFRFTYTRDTISTPSNIYIDDINITGTVTTGINNESVFNDIKIYPNPSEGVTDLSLTLSKSCRVKINVRDVSGRKIMDVKDNFFNEGVHHFMIGDKSKLQPGVYFVDISIDDKSVTKKIVIQ